MSRIQKLLRYTPFLILFLGIAYFAFAKYYLNQVFQSFTSWLYPDPNTTDARAKTLELMFNVVAAAGIFYGLYISHKRATATEKAVQLQGKAIKTQTDQLVLSQKSQREERFKNAIEHLGSEKEAIVIGGVAELHQIASEDPENYASVVVEIFTAYIRNICAIGIDERVFENPTIPQMIINNLIEPANKYVAYNNDVFDLSMCDLSNTQFIEKSFLDFDFSNSRLPFVRAVDFIDCTFGDSYFMEDMEKCTFFKCKFEFCELPEIVQKCKFIECSFNFVESGFRFMGNVLIENCKMVGLNFVGSSLMDCRVKKSKIIRGDFTLGSIKNVELSKSKVMDCDFSCVLIDNVRFYKGSELASNILLGVESADLDRPRLVDEQSFLKIWNLKSEQKLICQISLMMIL